MRRVIYNTEIAQVCEQHTYTSHCIFLSLWFTELWPNLGQISNTIAHGSANHSEIYTVRRRRYDVYSFAQSVICSLNACGVRYKCTFTVTTFKRFLTACAICYMQPQCDCPWVQHSWLLCTACDAKVRPQWRHLNGLIAHAVLMGLSMRAVFVTVMRCMPCKCTSTMTTSKRFNFSCSLNVIGHACGVCDCHAMHMYVHNDDIKTV